MTDERALRLAEKIADKAVPGRHMNHWRCAYDGALAAIKLTTKLAAEYADRETPKGPYASHHPCAVLADDYRSFDHLPADGGEK